VTYVLKILSLAGDIASVMSLPLRIVPAIIWIALGQWELKMKIWKKYILASVFTIGICAYIVDIADRFDYLKPLLPIPPVELVYDKTFINERVPLDGYMYNHCKFINVKFIINGTGKGGIENSEVGPYWVESDNSLIQSAFASLNQPGMLRVPVMDTSGKIIPPYGINPTFKGSPTPRDGNEIK
jgi:hypothetical protein